MDLSSRYTMDLRELPIGLTFSRDRIGSLWISILIWLFQAVLLPSRSLLALVTKLVGHGPQQSASGDNG